MKFKIKLNLSHVVIFLVSRKFGKNLGENLYLNHLALLQLSGFACCRQQTVDRKKDKNKKSKI